MEGTRTSLWPILLLNQLLLCSTEDVSTMPPMTSETSDESVGSVPRLVTDDHINSSVTDTNSTYGNCLIDTQMGLIAIGSAGGLIVCLLVTTMVLACQVFHIQRRVSAPRTSRSNMDLVSSTGYWDTDRPEVGGLIGPCDASVMLEEVREESNTEEERQAGEKGVNKGGGTSVEEGATAMFFDPDETAIQMQTSIPRDSCLVVPKDLEDMPLVV